jgi:2',3'-cyclic-nucleotide 2'-phosphodiesterase (5'-nucleotidase family)
MRDKRVVAVKGGVLFLQIYNSGRTPFLSAAASAASGPGTQSDLNSTLNTLLGASIASASGAKIALMGRLSGNAEGKISERDIYHLFPHSDNIMTLELTATEFKEILREQFRMMKKETFQSPWNLCAEIDKKGNVTGPLKFGDGTVWEDSSPRVKTAINPHILKAANHLDTLKRIASNPAARQTDTGVKILDAVTDYVRKNSPLDISPQPWITVRN